MQMAVSLHVMGSRQSLTQDFMDTQERITCVPMHLPPDFGYHCFPVHLPPDLGYHIATFRYNI